MDNYTEEERKELINYCFSLIDAKDTSHNSQNIARIALSALEAEPGVIAENLQHLDWSGVSDHHRAIINSAVEMLSRPPTPPAASAVPDELIPVPDEFLDADQNEKGLFELSEDCMCRLAVALAQQSKGRVIPPAEIRVPDGWKLVPAEPTDEMIAAAMDCDDVSFDKDDDSLFYVHHNSIYTAMLAAAPSPIASE